MKALLRGTAVVLALAILTASHLPKGTLPSFGIHYRIQHVVAYGLLAALCLAASRARGPVVAALVAVGAVAVVGALDEATQPVFGRQGNLLDWLTDLGGACLAVAACLAIGWKGFRRDAKLTRQPQDASQPTALSASDSGRGSGDEPGL
ncbi:MAG: VanZ family protein [Planctomycetota bacterium]